MTIHLVKLCVGVESFEHLQSLRDAQSDGPHTSTRHVTRMWPKRAEELLDGGSLYWVIKGVVQARQKITALEEVIGADGIRRCAIVMDSSLVRTHAVTRRAFQGWRYLAPNDAPPDVTKHRKGDDILPDSLATALGEIGVL